MKILHTVEFYPPSIGGMQEVVKQISERLVKLGHDMTVATTYLPERKEKMVSGVKVAEFQISGNFVRGLVGEIENYEKFLLENDFDIITSFAAQQWATDIALPLLKRIKCQKVFVPTGFSGLYLPEYQQYFDNMKDWMKEFNINIFLSNNYRDINFAKSNNIDNITLIPNGAAADEFLASYKINIRELLGIPQNHHLILSVGSHTGLKGHTEAIRIFSEATIDNVTLLIVGNNCRGGCTKNCFIQEKIFNISLSRLRDNKRLIIKALSRPETIAAYQQSNLFLFPSNIECSPLVLFECMASKTPYLTTDVGNTKEIIEWSQSGLLLPTIKDNRGYGKADIKKSSSLLESIFYDQEKQELMKNNGFASWEKKFTWEGITTEYEKLYFDLLNKA